MAQFIVPLTPEEHATFKSLAATYKESMANILKRLVLQELDAETARAERWPGPAGYAQRMADYYAGRDRTESRPYVAPLVYGNVPASGLRPPTLEEFRRNANPAQAAFLAELDAEEAEMMRERKRAELQKQLDELEGNTALAPPATPAAHPQDTLPRPPEFGGHSAALYPNGNPWGSAAAPDDEEGE